MVIPAATPKSFFKKMFLFPFSLIPLPTLTTTAAPFSASSTLKNKLKSVSAQKQVKRRTRSDRYVDEETFLKNYSNGSCAHVPVLLGEVLDVFSAVAVSSFVDCTVGAAGHSAEIIKVHPEMKLFVGLDVDPIASELAEGQISGILDGDNSCSNTGLQVKLLVQNYRNIKSVLCDVDRQLVASGVNGILMDLGMSSMQVNNAKRGFSVLGNGPLDMRMNPEASLRAEDILNFWPENEVGKVLRDYGEESNWYFLQNKIVEARKLGGLHSTAELVNLIRSSSSRARGGRQGWIKTATRVFQALRIAVNDELNTLREAVYECFDCLSPGGRLAVISFHSLEDRIVKQEFLNLINSYGANGGAVKGQLLSDAPDITSYDYKKEKWIKQIIKGQKGTILTKRPITPSEKEEALNPRSRSAKLRVIERI